MDKSGSDEDAGFIRRPHGLDVSPVLCDDRPSTPPMDHSLKVNRSLGLVMSPRSPPYRRIRAMNLTESPRSPRICLMKVPNGTSTPTAMPPWMHGFSKRLTKSAQRNRSNLSCMDLKERLNASCGNIASANPFTPDGRAALEEKKSRPKRIQHSFESSDSDCCEEEGVFQRSFKKLKLGGSRPRFTEEFVILEALGNGNHGSVFKCMQIFNGCVYAIKRTPRGIINELNEVYAHGVLDHPNVVRNFSCWTEPEFIFMQNEYCNGGTLDEVITDRGRLDQKELYNLLEQVAQGLRYMHDKQLAHMDIKPENILLTRGTPLFYKEDHFIHNDTKQPINETLYKIGDLGHVANLYDPANFEEGDCRYIPKEILNDNHADLTKVDIFALGLTIYEAAGGGSLPKNGEQWHDIRSGNINPLPDVGPELYILIKRMIEPNAELRPSAKDILVTLNREKKCSDLKAAEQKNQVLEELISKMIEPNGKLRPSAKDVTVTLNMENESRKLKEAEKKIQMLEQQISRMVEPTAELSPPAKDILLSLNESRKLIEAEKKIQILEQQLSKAVKCVSVIALRSQKQDKLHTSSLNNNTSSINKNSPRTRSARLLAKGLKPKFRN